MLIVNIFILQRSIKFLWTQGIQVKFNWKNICYLYLQFLVYNLLIHIIAQLPSRHD